MSPARTSVDKHAKTTRATIAALASEHLGVDAKDPRMKTFLDELMKSTPWVRAEPLQIVGVVARSEIAEMLGVKPESVSMYQTRDAQFPVPALRQGAYWLTNDVLRYEELRKTRRPGRPRLAPKADADQ